jgi:hypothetical protein
VTAQSIRESLNPIARKKFMVKHLDKERVVAFRIISKNTL